MKFSAALNLPPLTLGSVILPRQSNDRGQYNVPELCERKVAVLGAGGNIMNMAIAMLETETMTIDYRYGDGKTGDATNFGIFKQNWMMLRHSASEFKGETAQQVDDGAILIKDLEKDIKARHDSETFFGFDRWCGGHRNGASGLKNPNTTDIAGYKSATQWIQQQIEGDKKYQSDNTRFWVQVQAI